MTAAFGEISTMDAVDDGAPHEAEQSAPEIDLNDPRLTSENVDNPEADAYATPPPAPDGLWRAKLKQVDIKNKAKGNALERYIVSQHPKMNINPKTGEADPFFVTNLESSLIDLSGKYDGVKIVDNWVKSFLDPRRGGTSQMSTIIQKAGGTVPAKSSEKQRVDLLLKTLAGEPEVIVETAWEASCQTCQEAAKKSGGKSVRPFLVGMHRFPQIKGGHDPIVACPTCKAQARAQVRIAQYFSIAEKKPTRGVA